MRSPPPGVECAPKRVLLSRRRCCFILALPRDAQPILGIDEEARAVEGGSLDLMQHSFGANGGIDCALLVPDGGVFLGHAGAVEARVDQQHRVPLPAQLLRQQHPGDIAGGARHVVSVVAPLVGVLGSSPIARASLRGDDDNFSSFGQLATVDQGRVDPQRTDGADVDLLELLVEVQRVGEDQLLWPVEVPGVVDHNVDWSIESFGHGLDAVSRSHIHAGEHLLHAQRVQLVRRRPAGDHHLRAASDQLRGDGEAEPAVAAGDEHTLALEVRPVVHRVDVQVPRVLLLLRTLEPRRLVGQREDAVRLGRRGRGRDASATRGGGGDDATGCARQHVRRQDQSRAAAEKR
mmetsp:Transcript_27374/g.88411  ORF Transcript_27374/g.88411 Transcript_27374/m.88411 type:complete len:348 (-) Transcript_27374:39-1082(-)